MGVAASTTAGASWRGGSPCAASACRRGRTAGHGSNGGAACRTPLSVSRSAGVGGASAACGVAGGSSRRCGADRRVAITGSCASTPAWFGIVSLSAVRAGAIGSRAPGCIVGIVSRGNDDVRSISPGLDSRSTSAAVAPHAAGSNNERGRRSSTGNCPAVRATSAARKPFTRSPSRGTSGGASGSARGSRLSSSRRRGRACARRRGCDAPSRRPRSTGTRRRRNPSATRRRTPGRRGRPAPAHRDRAAPSRCRGR